MVVYRAVFAVAMQDGSTNPGLVLFAEEPPGEWMAKARNLLRADLGPAPRIVLSTCREATTAETRRVACAPSSLVR